MKKIVFVLLCMVFVFAAGSLSAAEWYKGQLHCHSLWSDGDTLPELVLDWYRADGFNFVALTDHSALQTDKNRWKEVNAKLVEESRSKFGNDWVQTKEENGKTLTRLVPIDELGAKFNKDGAFLVIPSHEQNAGVAGRTLHAIAANITETIPFPKDAPTVAAGALQWRKNTLDNAEKNGKVGFWMLNHPDWPYYDIPPSVFIEAPEIEFFEYNTTSAPRTRSVRPFRNPRMPDPEKFWDIINAFRIFKGQKPIFHVASDDTHCYRVFKDNGVNPGNGWVVVRAEKLDADSLFTAMKKGDFYSSTGVTLKDIRFDAQSKTLFVDIKPEEGVKYSVSFIGTKKGFNTATTEFDDPAEGEKPARTGLIYSDEIGATFKTVEGVSVSYKMAPEDLYVRAIITSDKKPKYLEVNKPPTESAWTQPYGW
ncbi:MAG: hypothetical protein FWE67_10650 [Planctomycetaceae bacterium]|nr:hypothetical protein [Planctomycetaceae bacterium]